jgi:uncharacterized membrane protein
LTLVVVLLGAGFSFAPWSLEEKTHAALHGLCAQIPSHTFVMGNRPLPFDARMTGIYGGFLVSFVWLMIHPGGLRRAALPPVGIGAILAMFVGIMGLDGTNSLLLDLGLPYLYTPDNVFRILTGALTGVSLAVMVGYLFAVTLWANADYHRPVIGSVREIMTMVGLTVPPVIGVLSGASWLYEPVTIMLLASAVIVVSSLTLILLLLATKRDCRYTQFVEAEGTATVAVIIGVMVMAVIAGSRFWLEMVSRAPVGT